MRRTLIFSLGTALAMGAWACSVFQAAEDPPTPAEAGAESGLPESSVPDTGVGDAGDAGDVSCWSRKFGAPKNVPELSSTARDLSARLSADELTAFVTSERPGGAGGRDIWVNKRMRVDAPFGAAALLSEVDTALTEDHASLAVDGLNLYFEHAAPAGPDGGGSPDLYVTHRSSTGSSFGPSTLVEGVNTAAGESFPYIAPLGALYFASDRDGPSDEYHLFVAPLGMPFGAPVALASLNQAGSVSNNPVVSKDGLTIYFASTRPGAAAQGDFDIWVARRGALTDAFGAPENVAELNSPSGDRPTWISSDGCRIYVVSDRPGTTGDLDIWIATR